MKALRLPTAYLRVLICFARSPCVPPHSCLATALQEDRGSLPGQGLYLCRPPCSGSIRTDAIGISQVFRRSFLCSAAFHDPGRIGVSSPLTATSMLPPLSKRRALRRWDISGLTRSFNTCCRTLHVRRYHRRAKLASGWLVGLYQKGVEPLWIATKGFSSLDDHPPFLLS
jgi:hypothetical protein